MKALLAKLTPHKGIGLYVGDDEVVVSLVASTPLGVVEIACRRESFADGEPAEVIGRLLKPLMKSPKRSPPIAVGIPARRVFFSTRPINGANASASPQALLREVLQSPNVRIDEMTVEVAKGDFGKTKLASIASCRKEYLRDVLQVLQQCGVQPYRTEPAPLALLRVGNRARRARRSKKPVLRLFLGKAEALVIVTAGNVCVFWKSFKLAGGREVPTLLAALRSSRAMIRNFGIDTPADVVIAHGRADLREALTAEKFVQAAGAPVVWCSEPELSGEAIAYGLALSCVVEQPNQAIDLSRSMTPSPSLWQIFPWGEVAVQIALVLCMGLFLLDRSHGAEKAVTPVQAELAKHSWVGRKQYTDLEREQKDLAQKVNAIGKFVSTRILWSNYTYDISLRLPTSATLKSFQGVCELSGKRKSKSKPKKSFMIMATAPVDADGSTPKDIDRFLDALRNHPLLQKDFPIVEVTEIKTAEATRGEPPQAYFTVICLPKGAKRGGR